MCVAHIMNCCGANTLVYRVYPSGFAILGFYLYTRVYRHWVRTRVSREIGFDNQMPIKTMGLSVVAQRFKQRCYCACAVFGNFELLGF